MFNLIYLTVPNKADDQHIYYDNQILPFSNYKRYIWANTDDLNRPKFKLICIIRIKM